MSLKEYWDNDWTKQINCNYETCHSYNSVIEKMVKLYIFIIRLLFWHMMPFRKNNNIELLN